MCVSVGERESLLTVLRLKIIGNYRNRSAYHSELRIKSFSFSLELQLASLNSFSMTQTLPRHRPPPPPPPPPRRPLSTPSILWLLKSHGYERSSCFKSGVGQNVALYASPTARNSAFLIFSTLISFTFIFTPVLFQDKVAYCVSNSD